MPNGLARLALPAGGLGLFFLEPGPEFVGRHVDEVVEFAERVNIHLIWCGMPETDWMVLSLSLVILLCPCWLEHSGLYFVLVVGRVYVGISV